MCTRCEGYGGPGNTGCGMLDYRSTALERRHPAIVARKRRDARNALEEARYRLGDCIGCGDPLDDVSLSEGFERCGDCDD